MEDLIGKTLDEIQIGDVKGHEQMAVAPLTFLEQHGPVYLTLSQGFEDSGILMARSLRSKKQASVTRNVRETKSYRSDQGDVWNDVSSLHADLGTSSRTGAMRDAYEFRKLDIEGDKF